jgi:hypothetical protein
MGDELQTALDSVDDLAKLLFQADPTTRSVGVGFDEGRLSFIVIRNLAGREHAAEPRSSFGGFLVKYRACDHDPTPLHAIRGAPVVPEQGRHRPLVCGLEIQNLDHDLEELLPGDAPNAGTLGCFVRLADDSIGFVSNNHILAGENEASIGDRIVQPSEVQADDPEVVATLSDFVPLVRSRQTTVFGPTGPAPNVVDAAVAKVDLLHLPVQQQYLPHRVGRPPMTSGAASLGLPVHKVGRGTGESFGIVRQVGVVVGPLQYMTGQCWFRRSIIIETTNPTAPPFSSAGDSGAAVVDDQGNAVGLVYGGLPGVPGQLPHQTYACPMNEVLRKLNCRLL